MARRRLAALALALGTVLGFSCDLGSSGIFILVPLGDAPVVTPTFTVEVRISSEIQPATLAATLNGTPLPLALAGDGGWKADLAPGAALRDENTLVVNALTHGGQARSETRHFEWLPPKARLRRITDPADLATGPLAHGRIGDFVLVNDVARFVVQDVAQRDLHSVGAFGGNLIDAELLSRPGLESFFELQPALNIETVLNAQTATIVNDGQNGLPAVLRVCGPDDLMDYVNPSSVVAEAGGIFPPGVDDLDRPIEACSEYVLEPGLASVRIDTTVTNLSGANLGLYVGDYINGMGALEQWTPPRNPTAQTNLGIGEVTATLGNEVFSYIGFGEAEGVDYALLGAAPPTPSSSFTVSGVSYVLHANSIPVVLIFGSPSPFVVPANGDRSFTRWFGVGDGSGANAVALQARVQSLAAGTVEGCVTVGGAPAPGARVSAGFASGGAITQVRSVWVTDTQGCYRGVLPAGSYGIAAAREGTPYEGGGATPLVHPIVVTDGGSLVQDMALPATGRVAVTVTDPAGLPVPARVSIVGFDPSPEPRLVTSALSGNDTTTGVFNDVAADGLPFGITKLAYAGADGSVAFDLEPGSYQVFVSRGSEWSAYSAPLAVAAGATTPVAAQIAQVIDTAGFVSSDFHVHALNSPDSRIQYDRRVLQFAGEGVDNVVMTDHDARTDLDPVIAALGLTPFVASTIGEEITSFDYGHFNAYPLGQDPTRISKGSVDHGRAAPPGQDFPSAGSFSLSPAEIQAAVLSDPSNSPQVAVQINHIGSHFGPLRIDSALEPPQSVLTPAEQASFRLDPSIPNLFHPFAALELWNGYNRSHALNEFLRDRIGIWMNLLNQGIVSTAIADTDTHEFFNLRSGGARSWTASSTDAPAAIDDDEIGAAVRSGRVVGGQGVYVQTRLLATDGSGGVAHLGLGGSNLLSVTNGAAELEIRVQAPLWAEYDRIEVYVNAATQVTGTNGGVPVSYTAVPSLVLDAGTDFTRTQVDDYPAIPGAGHFETTHAVPLALPQDAWVVVVVRGRDGVSRPMFPVMPASLQTGGNGTLAALLDGNLGQGGVPALGFTNALFADTDGNGVYDPPGVLVVP